MRDRRFMSILLARNSQARSIPVGFVPHLEEVASRDPSSLATGQGSKSYLVQTVPGSLELSNGPGAEKLLIDQRGLLHRIYGARDACAYLIRHDGYVGFSSQPG